MEKKKFIENKDTRILQGVLNLPEIRSGRLSKSYSSASISYFKTGVNSKINENIFVDFRNILNDFSVKLKEFSKKPTVASDAYLKTLLDLIDTPFLNFREVYRKAQSNVSKSPNYSVLLWSYYNSKHRVKQEPKGELIERYLPFFEQLKFEFIVLSKKIKI